MVTASGPISEPLSRLRDRLKDSAAVQSFLGTPGDSSGADERIHEYEAAGDANPCVILSVADRVSEQQATAGWVTSQALVVEFQRDEDTSISHNDDSRTFTNELGAIEGEIKTALLDLADGGLSIQRIEGPNTYFEEKEQNGTGQWAGVMVLFDQGI